MQDNSKPTTNSVYRRGYSNGLPLGWIPWVAGILLISGPVFAQSQDAMFIDEKGQVKAQMFEGEGSALTVESATLAIGKL